MQILLISAAVIYLLSPVDLFPESIFGIPGYIDDIIGAFLLWYFYNKRKKSTGYWRYSGNDRERQDENTYKTDDADERKDPYRVLGILPGADITEVKKAYREMSLKYHPDKVAHLGDEFKIIAEKRFIEIKEAYETIKKELGA